MSRACASLPGRASAPVRYSSTCLVVSVLPAPLSPDTMMLWSCARHPCSDRPSATAARCGRHLPLAHEVAVRVVRDGVGVWGQAHATALVIPVTQPQRVQPSQGPTVSARKAGDPWAAGSLRGCPAHFSSVSGVYSGRRRKGLMARSTLPT